MRQTQANEQRIYVLVAPWPALDKRTAGQFRQLFSGLIAPQTKMVIDLSLVRAIDGFGFQSILEVNRQVSEEGGCLKICGLNQPVRTLFQLARLHRTIEIYNDKEEAVRTFH